MSGIPSIIGSLSVRTKINVIITLIFVSVVILVTLFTMQRTEERVLGLVTDHTKSITDFYFDSLNTMMLTDTMDQRSILREKILKDPDVLEARVVRGQSVMNQHGPGLPEESPVDEYDRRALMGEEIIFTEQRNSGRVVTVLTPIRATNDGDTNCLACHNVPSGTVNGLVRVSYSLADIDENMTQEMWTSALANLLLMVLGLFLANFLLRRWISDPLASLIQVVKRRANGDSSARAVVTSSDEVGRLGMALNAMSDKLNDSFRREQEVAQELRHKVDILLEVVNRAAKGDLETAVSIPQEGAIGELGAGLEVMLGNIRALMDERRTAVEELKQKVGAILGVVARAAEGDLTGKVTVSGDDSVGQLAEGVQRMVDRLNTLVTQVQQSGIKVTSSATQIAATAKQQEATLTEQAATINEIVATATEISATNTELVRTMDEVSSGSEQTAAAASSGQEGLAKMEETMHHVVNASGAIANKLEVLNEKANNINTVVTTITKVADQTNLLSLNAAIEAEKAGEYGVGFAVVATEIRRLADQTAGATLDIEQMVKEVQTAVSAGVMSVDKFSKEVQNSAEVVRDVGHDLTQIIEQVQALTPRFESVHEGMQFQAQGAEQIKQAIVQLSSAAQQTVESLNQSSSSIDHLNDAAYGLQQGVSQFKVLSIHAKESEVI